jgi:hypothetical protein
MSEPAKQTLDWQPPRPAPGDQPPDPRTMRLRWRLITRSTTEALTLRINQIAASPQPEPILLTRWRPLSAPSNPRPAWRWPGRARAERASQRASIGERWRSLTAR